MRIKYLIFFDTLNGKGNTEIKVKWKERIKGIESVNNIQEEIEKKENTKVVMNNYKYIGWSLWK